ncbi:hypothetical protein [Geminicoccus roseus]|uniref:hypothetical protein n=1 Tax=Geminicoccus roseus TaxID=404900 RepID=UPI0003FF4E99|nr:hypothetical protein [Geminicoccus roseus]
MLSGTSLVGRLALTAFVIVLASLALSATLNLLKFEKVVRQKEQARFEFLTRDLASTIQDGMRIGLPLNALRSLQPLIDRRRTIDRLIEWIVIFDDKGRRLYTTDRTAAVDQPVPAAWQEASRLEPGQVAQPVRLDVPVIVVPLVNLFDRPVGGLAVGYSESGIEQTMLAIRVILGQAILEASVPAAVVLILGVAMVMHRTRRRMRASTVAVMSAIDGSADRSSTSGGAPDPVASVISETLDRLARTERHIERADLP